MRLIDRPADCKQYTGHTAATTVARFSPSGFYIASGDVSGMVRVWDAVEAVNTKGEYGIISGRINDIAWDGDSQRIIAVGDGKERFGHWYVVLNVHPQVLVYMPALPHNNLKVKTADEAFEVLSGVYLEAKRKSNARNALDDALGPVYLVR